MKKLILSSAVMLLFAVAANAQSEAAPAATKTETPAQDKKKEIKYDELPQTVKTTLGTDAYKSWEVVKVWHNETKDNYEIEVKNATETKTLKFDKEGKEIVE